MRIRCTLALILALTGCYQYRTTVVNVTPATDQSKTVWPILWGLGSKKQVADCQGQALASMTVKDNLGFALITVVTLGFLSPKRVEWSCAPPNPQEGRLGPTPPPRPPAPPARER